MGKTRRNPAGQRMTLRMPQAAIGPRPSWHWIYSVQEARWIKLPFRANVILYVLKSFKLMQLCTPEKRNVLPGPSIPLPPNLLSTRSAKLVKLRPPIAFDQSSWLILILMYSKILSKIMLLTPVRIRIIERPLYMLDLATAADASPTSEVFPSSTLCARVFLVSSG